MHGAIAEAGIQTDSYMQSDEVREQSKFKLDSRFRGNDRQG